MTTMHSDTSAVRTSNCGGPPGRPQMLSHAAFISSDTSATAEFYAGLLGMNFHSFFRMGDGSTIAFFEAPELAVPSADSHPAYATFRHFAMQVESTAEVDAWAVWLTTNEVDVLGPVDHGIIYSIYFRDPDGNRLEITTPTDARWNDDATAARASLAEWEAVKAHAKVTGQDMASVLADLTRERSHRRASELLDA